MCSTLTTVKLGPECLCTDFFAEKSILEVANRGHMETSLHTRIKVCLNVQWDGDGWGGT